MLRVERLNLTLSAGAVAASWALFSPQVAGGLAAGAAVEALSFRTLHGAARQFFAGNVGGPGLWMGVVGLRLGVLMGAVVLLLVAGTHPVGLVAGLSMVIPAVVIDAWRHRPPVVDQSDYPVPPPDDPSWDRISLWGFSRPDPAEAQEELQEAQGGQEEEGDEQR